MSWIEIDEEVLGQIKAQAEPFLDSPNDVLRRLLDLVEGVRPTCATPPSERPLGAAAWRWRPDAGEALPEGGYELPILKALAEQGGRSRARAVMRIVGGSMASSFSAADRVRMTNNEERWSNRLRFCRRRMLERGYVRRDSPRGVWEITEAGIERLGQLEAQAGEERSA